MHGSSVSSETSRGCSTMRLHRCSVNSSPTPLSTFAIDSSASDSSGAEGARPRPRVAWVAALVAWALVACFNRLGEAPVFITNEAREGVYVRAMLASENFVAPPLSNHLENGEWIPDKPPLFHWRVLA